MQSKAIHVDEYIAEATEERQDVLKQLRTLFLQELINYEEKMEYGGPCYARGVKIEAGFANQKHFIGVYILKQKVYNKYISDLNGATHGKGVIRFTDTRQINFTVIQKMLKATYKMADKIC